jgi:hypothetical protein
VWPGESLIVELAPDDAPYLSDVMATYDAALNTISVQFNDIENSDALLTIVAKRSTTLRNLKAEALVILRTRHAEAEPKLEASVYEMGDVHFKRNGARGPMLKDESKSLKSFGLVEGSLLWLSKGKPCLPNEFMIDFVHYDPADPKIPFRPFMITAISETMKINSLKQFLATHLGNLDPQRLRLRDKKMNTLASILRDTTSIRRSLLGLSDGRQVAVQVLEFPETSGPDEIILR